MNLLSIGKPKEAWIQQVVDSYCKRLNPHMSIQWSFFKKEKTLEKTLVETLKKKTKNHLS